MEETREAVEVTMRHPTSGHTLVQKRHGMLYHHPDDPPDLYRGETVSSTYFWCSICGKAYMTTWQFGNEEFKSEAHKYDFVLARSNIPVQVVPWIKS